MTTTIQIASYGTIDDLLFRGKNKAYGAYQLRKEYEHRLRRAVFLFFVSLTSVSFIILGYQKMVGNYIYFTDGTLLDGGVYTPTEFTEIKIEQPKQDIPVAAQDVKSIISTTPVIVKDVPPVDINSTEDLLRSDALISYQDNSGTTALTPSADPIIVGKVDEPVGNVYDPNQVFDIVTNDPEFPGDLPKFLGDHAKFPTVCEQLGYAKGLVIVGFVVNEDGRISNIHLEKADHESFNEQALKAVKAMPKWIPGSNNGHKVKVNMSIPFNFVYSE